MNVDWKEVGLCEHRSACRGVNWCDLKGSSGYGGQGSSGLEAERFAVYEGSTGGERNDGGAVGSMGTAYYCVPQDYSGRR